MRFVRFLLIWISQNLAIPFWVVGHIHLSIHDFHQAYELLSSLAMNIVVGIGFYLDYVRTRDTEEKNKRTRK